MFVIDGGCRTGLKTGALVPLGKPGASGAVFRITEGGYRGLAAKLYLPGKGQSRAKLEAMIAKPPSNMFIGTSGDPQFAWPKHLVEDRQGKAAGFLMPEIDFARSTSLVPYLHPGEGKRNLSINERCLPGRYNLCRNLAIALHALHSAGHQFVDLKDLNIRVFKDSQRVACLDTDGYCINAANGVIFPADAWSGGYIAPEALRQGLAPGDVGVEQDFWALGILIFQCLTCGMHPFQVAAQQGTQLTNCSLDDLVKDCCYPFDARGKCTSSANRAYSITYLHDRTLSMLHSTFTGAPNRRITAEQWADHFSEVLA